MPPKPKFTREDIIDRAICLVAEKGIDALTARELGNTLGSSSRPIFTAFRNMEEVEQAVREEAMRRFEKFVGNGDEKMPHFKKIGMNTVRFAVAQPMLFRLLFMRETSASVGFEGIYPRLGKTADECISDIQNDYCLDESEAQRLFESMWIYTFGIGALCAMRVCVFSEEELSAMLSYEFEALLLSAKRRN